MKKTWLGWGGGGLFFLGTAPTKAVDHARGGQAAAAERRDPCGPAWHSARPQGGSRLSERGCPLAVAAPAEVRVLRRRNDQSGVCEGDLSPHAECGLNSAAKAVHSG